MSEDARTFDFDQDYGATYQDRIRRIVPGYDDLAAMVLGELSGLAPYRARVLVVGPGAGEELEVMGRLRPSWRLAAVDSSLQMVSIAEERMRRAGLTDRVEILHGVVDDLPPDPVYDAATLSLVMHFVRDDGGKLELLRGIATRLRDGAPLTLVDGHGDIASAEFRQTFEAWMRYLILRGMTPEELEQYRARVAGSVHWVPESRIRALLTEAGFGPARQFYRGYVFGGWIALRG